MPTSDSRRLERADKARSAVLTSRRRRRAEMLKCQTQPMPDALRISGRPGDDEEGVLERISRERFIRLGSALGVGAACASLVACGGGASSSGGGGSGGGNAGGGDSGGGEHGGGAKAGGAAIVSESEVAPGSAHKFEDSGNPAVLVHLDNGDFVAYSAVCTHQGCDVAYKDGNLACPCHGSVFDPADGAAVVAGPAQRPLPEIPVKVEGGEVVRA
jgi:cytochrome b6-f complex iron-sulfur subunit